VFRKHVNIVVLVFMGVAGIANAKTSAIDAKYKAVGEATLGKPSGKEKSSAGGRVRLYANGGIYSSSATGTHAVYGPEFEKYRSLGAEKGKLGFPVTDVLINANGIGTQTIFRHGYILGGKSGAIVAEVTPKATFTSNGVTFSGGAKAAMKSSTEALLPQSGPTGDQTVNCMCAPNPDSHRLELGMCTISTKGSSSIRCTGGSCSKGCQITITKTVQ